MALVAFAGNSVLCRLALYESAIDPASFTSIRLLSGAVFLVVLVALKNKALVRLKGGSRASALFLFAYALSFSFSYVTLDTGTGALILFGSVQLTMIAVGVAQGQKPGALEWLGLLVACAGLVLLLLPGAEAPSMSGFALMLVAGIAWAFYTLAGRGSQTPLQDTAANFVRTLPLVVLVTLLTFQTGELTGQGIVLAVASGALTSGLGYAIWYAALRGLTITQAAVFQLSVPIIASIGGVLFSSEVVTGRLVAASVLVLGGVLVVIASKLSRAS